MKLTNELASQRVRAALGRAPQDRLEATVVLESWGVSPDLALAVARPDRDAGLLSKAPLNPTIAHSTSLQDALEIAGLLAGIMAATMCAGPIISRLGGSAVDAWRIALPVTLFLQWTLRRYHRTLSARARRERLSGFRSAVWGGTALSVGIMVPAMLVLCPVAGAAFALVVLWTGCLFLSRRGWAPVYVALLLAGALAVGLRLSVVPVIADESETMLVLMVIAVVSSHRSQQLPGSWLEALRSGCIGALLGCLIVNVALPGSTTSVELLGLALAPSLLGSVVWFYFVAAFWRLLQPGIGLSQGSDSLMATHRRSRLINLSGLAGYGVTTVIISFAALMIASALGISSGDSAVIFLDLGTLGLAGVLFAWLDVLGRSGAALAVECSALTVCLLVHVLAGSGGLGSYGDLFGAVVAVILAEAVTYRLHGEPEWLSARML
ncbi:MAG: hypothetical protein ACLQRM_04950 [Acidimicrobiales bacterium]